MVIKGVVELTGQLMEVGEVQIREELPHGAQLRTELVFKKFQDSLSYRILRHMHRALNIDENKN